MFDDSICDGGKLELEWEAIGASHEEDMMMILFMSESREHAFVHLSTKYCMIVQARPKG